MTDMRTIKFDVEDSKVSGILQDLLNFNATVRDVEVTVARPNNEAHVVPYRYVVITPYAVPQPYVCDTWEDSTTWSV